MVGCHCRRGTKEQVSGNPHVQSCTPAPKAVERCRTGQEWQMPTHTRSALEEGPSNVKASCQKTSPTWGHFLQMLFSSLHLSDRFMARFTETQPDLKLSCGAWPAHWAVTWTGEGTPGYQGPSLGQQDSQGWQQRLLSGHWTHLGFCPQPATPSLRGVPLAVTCPGWHLLSVLFTCRFSKSSAYKITVKYYSFLPAGDPGHLEWSCGCSQILQPHGQSFG